MEVKSDLIKEERKELLKRFSASHFKKVAQIMIGEPTKDFKSQVHKLLLKEKQELADIEFRQKQAEVMQAKLLEKKQKELERERKRIEKAAKKAEAAAKRLMQEAARKEEEEKLAKESAIEKKEG